MKVPFAAKHLDAALCYPAPVRDARTAVILTHGAGGDMNFKHLVSLARCLASGGVICLRFTCKGLNLGYRVKAYRAVWVRAANISGCGSSCGDTVEGHGGHASLVFPLQDYLKSLENFNIRHVFFGGEMPECHNVSQNEKVRGKVGKSKVFLFFFFSFVMYK